MMIADPNFQVQPFGSVPNFRKPISAPKLGVQKRVVDYTASVIKMLEVRQ